MLTILFGVTVKAERETEFRAIAERLTTSTHAEDAGCIAYTFYRQTDNPLKVTLFEQWADQEALGAHMARLVSLLGPADDDESLPLNHVRRRLPRAFMDLFEETTVTRYEPLLSTEPAAT